MEQNKDFLVKEPIGKLLFRLAIPTVIAQMINMLYNIVDRIYIGHIPEVGALALTGVGVCMPLIMILSAFAALVDQRPGQISGRRLVEDHPFGKRRFAIGRKNYRQLFYPADSYFHRVDSDYAARREDISACIRSQRKYN